jgi:hypothetical protein
MSNSSTTCNKKNVITSKKDGKNSFFKREKIITASSCRLTISTRFQTFTQTHWKMQLSLIMAIYGSQWPFALASRKATLVALTYDNHGIAWIPICCFQHV